MPFDQTPPLVESPTVQSLRRGLRRIEIGWCQNTSFKKEDGLMQYCMLGANACDEPKIASLRRDTMTILALSIRKLRRRSQLESRDDYEYWEVVKFNDSPDRIKEDVVLAFHVAIELQIRKENGLAI